MIYTDLNKIPLLRFIDVFCGNYMALVINSIHKKEELEPIAQKLIYEYLSIVGGRQALAEVAKKNEELNLGMKIECMLACENLMKIGRYVEVITVLAELGYRMREDEHEKMKTRVKSILGGSRLRLDMIKGQPAKDHDKGFDKGSFVRERVMVMQHYKMHIDPSVFTAGEYAYMVKGMCEEIERMIKK